MNLPGERGPLAEMGLRLPEQGSVADNYAWRYYYTGEFRFNTRAVTHLRAQRVARLVRLVEDLKPRVVLDVGCGPAESTVCLRRRFGDGTRLVGLDLGWDSVAFGRALARANGHAVDFLQGDGTGLPFRDASVDLVVSMELIEHLPAWEATLAEWCRVLKPDGYLCFTTPTPRGLHTLVKQAFVGLHLNRLSWRHRRMSYERFLHPGEVDRSLRALGCVLRRREAGLFVFSFLPDWLYPANAAVERWLERIPGTGWSGVTAFYLYQKVAG
jgi:SAM-dependent methyltransferase